MLVTYNHLYDELSRLLQRPYISLDAHVLDDGSGVLLYVERRPDDWETRTVTLPIDSAFTLDDLAEALRDGALPANRRELMH